MGLNGFLIGTIKTCGPLHPTPIGKVDYYLVNGKKSVKTPRKLVIALKVLFICLFYIFKFSTILSH